MEKARSIVADTETMLVQQTIKMEDAFVDLMRNTLTRPGVRQGDMSGLDIDGLKTRIEKLERMDFSSIERIGPEPRDKGKSRQRPLEDNPQNAGLTHEAASTHVDPGEEGEDSRNRKRTKLRSLLKEMRMELETVRSFATDLEERQEDLQSQIWGNESDKLERIRLKIRPAKRWSTWEELEAKRDPTGELRGIEVLPNESGGDSGANNQPEPDSIDVNMDVDSSKAPKDMSRSAPLIASDEVVALQQQVFELQSNIGQLLQEREDREVKLAARILEDVRKEYGEVVKAVRRFVSL